MVSIKGESMAPATTTVAESSTARRLRIEFLFLDLSTCTRCRGTERSLEAALELVGEQLAASGMAVEVDKTHVTSAEQARELRFVSSPTLRVNGRDLALELRESPCGSESCTDGCGESIACRVWVHAGQEYTEPPVAMLVDEIMREIDGEALAAQEPDTASFELSENLERFFAAKDAEALGPQVTCCSLAERETCCEPGEKADCCGASGEGCGCR
jgi:hypothetical protein